MRSFLFTTIRVTHVCPPPASIVRAVRYVPHECGFAMIAQTNELQIDERVDEVDPLRSVHGRRHFTDRVFEAWRAVYLFLGGSHRGR